MIRHALRQTLAFIIQKVNPMTNYTFQTKEFGISDAGIHLLRSGFNYKAINFSEVNRIQIERGKELHNWWLIFIIGALLIVFGMYLSVGTIRMFIDGDIAPRHAKLIFLLLVPVVGAYFVYNSLRTGLVLRIHCIDGSKDMFPLEEILIEKRMKEFEIYLTNKVGPKFLSGA